VAWRAVALATLGRLPEARECLPGVAVGDQEPLARAAFTHALVRVGRGRLVVDSIARTRDELGPDSESNELRVLLHADLIDLLLQTGPAEALAAAIDSLPAMAALADPGQAAILRAAGAAAAYVSGRWTEPDGADPALAALAAARQMHAAPPRAAQPPSAPLAGAREWQPELAAISAEQNGQLDLAWQLRYQALEAARRLPPTRLHGAEHVVRLALAAGARDAAQRVADACAQVAADEGLPVQIALAALVRAQLNGDAAGLVAAVDQLRRHGALLQYAYGLEEAAVCLAGSGNRPEAARALRDAVRCYAGAGLAWDVARADGRLRGLGIRRRASADQPMTGWASLTPAEHRVVRLVARGMSNRDIAEALFLSENTIRTHLSRIRGKLGLRSRLDIARAAGFQAEPAGAPVRSRRANQP